MIAGQEAMAIQSGNACLQQLEEAATPVGRDGVADQQSQLHKVRLPFGLCANRPIQGRLARQAVALVWQVEHVQSGIQVSFEMIEPITTSRFFPGRRVSVRFRPGLKQQI